MSTHLARWVASPELLAGPVEQLALLVKDCACGVAHFALAMRAPDPDAPVGVVAQTTCPITDVVIDVFPDRRRAGR